MDNVSAIRDDVVPLLSHHHDSGAESPTVDVCWVQLQCLPHVLQRPVVVLQLPPDLRPLEPKVRPARVVLDAHAEVLLCALDVAGDHARARADHVDLGHVFLLLQSRGAVLDGALKVLVAELRLRAPPEDLPAPRLEPGGLVEVCDGTPEVTKAHLRLCPEGPICALGALDAEDLRHVIDGPFEVLRLQLHIAPIAPRPQNPRVLLECLVAVCDRTLGVVAQDLEGAAHGRTAREVLQEVHRSCPRQAARSSRLGRVLRGERQDAGAADAAEVVEVLRLGHLEVV
mmetsp:Transcript_82987/g.216279  ORF Transcript_82987/g.216279 Transcript_82987/m.216279 type:complete len:285 (+) Transcript_82987:618-1472(+)